MTQPSYKDILGYDPLASGRGSYGPRNKDEWAYSVAIALANRWANNTLGDTGVGTIWDARWWAAAGVGTPDPSQRGSGKTDEITFNQFLSFAYWLADNWENTSDAVRNYLSPPPRTQYGLTPDDEERLWRSQEAEKDRELQRDLENIRGQWNYKIEELRSATDRYIAELRAATDKEIAAMQDALERYLEEGRNRRFDLQLEEDRRQFNAQMQLEWARYQLEQRRMQADVVLQLFRMGVEVAANPVDWVAHQYFMQNYSVPLTMTGFIASTYVFGAIPPNGPSAAGPVVGGPGAIDGMQLLAMDLGVKPAFVPPSQAAQQYPGGYVGQVAAEFRSDVTLRRIADQYFNGDVSAIDREVDRARMNELLPTVGLNPVTAEEAPRLAERLATSMPSTSVQDIGSELSSFLSQMKKEAASAGSPPEGWQYRPKQEGARTDIFADVLYSAGAQAQQQPSASTGIWTGLTSAAQQPAAVGQQQPSSVSPLIYRPQQVVGGGQQQQQQQASSSVFNPATFGEDLLNQLSQLTGLPVEQLRRVIPTQLLAGGYTLQQLANSPIVQAMQQGTTPSRFRTAPVSPNERFGNLLALGIPMGLRGGQDFNLQSYLQGGPVNRMLMEGAIKAMGFDPSTFIWQASKTAPMTDITPGLRGRMGF
jgi:hypothetical protein